MMQQTVTILGSTGSIGKNTLDVIAQHPQAFSLYALTAHHSIGVLLRQCQQFSPKHVVIVDETAAKQFMVKARSLKLSCQIHVGENALSEVAAASEVDIVMAAIVGAAGLLPTLAAAKAGKKVLLANKESLVITGELFMNVAKCNNAMVLPVDSEHNAIFQCLPKDFVQFSLAEMGIKRLILTASGGPFRNYSEQQLQNVTPEQAYTHPNWKMGKKISVDSATLMNKGLEVIEARWLFNTSVEQIEAIIQPQSIIHSMVEYIDGSILAELGVPDMRTAISYSLGFPKRLSSNVKSLNFKEITSLEFQEIDLQRFPCMRLAYSALAMGGTMPACLNAANEIAVEAFLQGRIRFLHIAKIVEETMHTLSVHQAIDVETILAVDDEARRVALQFINTEKTTF